MGYRSCVVRKEKVNIIFKTLLWIAWLSGLFLGVLFSLYSRKNMHDLVHNLIVGHVTFLGLLAVSAVPLLICAILFWFQKSIYVIPVIALKAFLFAFSAQSIAAYSNGGWLLRWLLMLSDSFSVFLLLLFCCSCKEKQGSVLVSSIVLYLVFILLITCADYYIVHPFAASLFR